MLKVFIFVFVACLGLVSCAEVCKSYKSFVKPLIEEKNIKGLKEVFKSMNNKKQGVSTFRSVPIANTIWPEDLAINMLVSLSKPLVHQIEATNSWPENTNIRIATTGAAGVFDPSTSFHGGMRYVYNCATLQERTCFKKECKYDPSSPVLMARKNEQIYVPLENFIAANGDAMADHIEEHDQDSTYLIKGFSKLSVRECGARQLFFNGTSASACFDDLKFFSLPESLESRTKPEEDAPYDNKRKRQTTPQMRILVKRSYFVVMS